MLGGAVTLKTWGEFYVWLTQPCSKGRGPLVPLLQASTQTLALIPWPLLQHPHLTQNPQHDPHQNPELPPLRLVGIPCRHHCPACEPPPMLPPQPPRWAPLTSNKSKA